MLFIRSSATRTIPFYRGSLILCFLTVFLTHGSVSQDIVFPSHHPLTSHQENSQRRKIQTLTRVGTTTMSTIPASFSNTVTAATEANNHTQCPVNMVATREFNDTSDFCECVVGYLYYAKTDGCYKQYTQGPCKQGYHFILRSNETVAKCVRNPCKTENSVMYKGSCYGLLQAGGPCERDEVLQVPDESNSPECTEVDTSLYQLIRAPKKRCSAGSRALKGMCKEILS